MQVGLDLGSRTVKVAAVRDGILLGFQIRESGFDPHLQSMEMLREYGKAPVVATGYGRHLARKHFAHEAITEIKAHALGARHLFPACTTVLDVGGQDSKVILLDGRGRVANFQMNDKCAAGTGRFLEMMAAVLGFSLEEFGAAAAASSQGVAISSMCAVFAESEVVSLKNRGVPAGDIARAIHLAVAERLLAMLNRVGVKGELVFTGGVARNGFLVHLLRERLGRVEVPDTPDIVGALGAALYEEG